MYLSCQPEEYIHLDEIDSTNRWLLDSELPAGTICTAQTQTAGRGRQGRSWLNQPGSSLLFSALLLDDTGLLARKLSLLPLLCGLALIEAISVFIREHNLAAPKDQSLQIKWPNDLILLRQQVAYKLAGILLESRWQSDGLKIVIGVGLNWNAAPQNISNGLLPAGVLFPKDLYPNFDLQAREMCLPLAQAINTYLGYYYHSEDQLILDQLRQLFWLSGKKVCWQQERYRVVGLDAEGSLVLADQDQRQVSLQDTQYDIEVLEQ